jgi:predicted nuclease of predicted toxin-antitoxin system
MRLLLDEHVPPAVAAGLRGLGVDTIALRDWHGGGHLGARDADVLTAARVDGLVLVSYDQRTLRPLLRDWSETSERHSGVIFISHQTLAANDIGGLMRALKALADRSGEDDWTDRVVFLRRG